MLKIVSNIHEEKKYLEYWITLLQSLVEFGGHIFSDITTLPINQIYTVKEQGIDGVSCMYCSVSLACRQLRFSLLSGQL